VTPDDDAIEAIRARWRRDPSPVYGADAFVEGDVRTLLAALDARTAEAQRERERAEAAERLLADWPRSAHLGAQRSAYHARREAIEETRRTIVERLRAEGLRARELLQATRAHHYAHAAHFVELLDPRTDLAPREAPSTDEGTAGG
jgi:hypothetical protein